MEHEAQECKFCRLIQGQEKCHKVYEDENAFVFLDKHPVNPGHLLVIPKQHVADFYNLDDKLYSQIMLVVKRLAQVVNEVFEPKKVGFISAGFDIPHTHLHIISMYDYKDIGHKYIYENNRPDPTEKELEDIKNKLSLFLEDSR